MSHPFRWVSDTIEPEFSGVAVTGCAAEPDDPQPVPPPAIALEILTLAMVRTLAEAGVNPGECAAAAFDIRNRLMTALRTTDAS